MVEIRKLVETETAHIVRDAVSFRCSQGPHGHSYKWEIGVKGNPGQNGMVMDFKELGPVKDFIDKFDHAFIFWSKENQEDMDFYKRKYKRIIVMKKNVTAENMACLLHKFTSDWLVEYNKEHGTELEVGECRVWETRTGSAIAYDHDENDVIDEMLVAESY